MILDPRQRFDLVKDPVHGYIRFTKKRLTDDEIVQEEVQKMLQEQYFYLAPAYEEAVFAGRLRREWLARGYTLALSDVTNAALAISRKLALVTRNVSHYPFSELAIIGW